MNRRHGLLGLGLSLLTLSASCSSDTGEADRKFAKIYSEILLAQMTYAGDPVQSGRVTDSLLKGSQFKDLDEMKIWLIQMAQKDADRTTRILDSTQARLERIRDGKMADPGEETGSND